MNSRDYKQIAKESLKGNRVIAIAVMFIIAAFSTLTNVIPGIGSLVVALISAQLTVGETHFYDLLINKKEPGAKELFHNFRYWFRSFCLQFATGFYVFCWSILFVIPGILKSYSYSMAFYLRTKNPELKAKEALSQSMKLMYGRRWKLFCLQLSFIGWYFFSVLTFGLGLFYVVPYYKASLVAFYDVAYDEYHKHMTDDFQLS